MTERRVLITGIAGQDGAYLARLLLRQGATVFGAARATSNLWRLKALDIRDRLHFLPFDLSDPDTFDACLKAANPTEIYNLAAVSSLGDSEAEAERTRLLNYQGPLELIQRALDHNPEVRIFQASSALVFGRASEAPQTELTPRAPDTAYGEAKLALDEALEAFRLGGAFAVSGILFNHESPLRAEHFVSQKIMMGLAALARGAEQPIELRAFDHVRDWSHAEDFVRAMTMSLQLSEPASWVFASGEAHTVRDWLALAAPVFGFEPEYRIDGDREVSVCRRSGRVLAIAGHGEPFAEPGTPRIGSAKAFKAASGWVPNYGFSDLVEDMATAAKAR